MKKQIALFTLCLIAVLVSLSAVSAANLTVGTGGTYSNIDDAYDDAVDGDTIFIKNGNYTGYVNTGINIAKNINITGESQTGTIIDANHDDNIFYIADGYTVTISKLTLRDGQSAGYAGAINNYGTCNVNNCTFDSNYAEDGGAIYNDYDGIMTITGCTFTNNEVDTDGGAIYNEGDLTITGSTFDSNYAEDGGAIYNCCGDVIIKSCTFTNNEADDCCGGGAIYNDNDLTVTDSTFTGNTATDSDGGAIYQCCGELTLTRCIFNGNTADEDGGAIYFSDESLNITGCNFNKNTAGDNGGAIYIEGYGGGYGAAAEDSYEVNVKYSRFVGNTADGTAQDIYMDRYGTELDAKYNWWGSNNGPAAGRIAQSEGTPSNEIYTPWLVMNINPADPSTIYTGQTSKISVNVYTDSNGVDHSADADQFFSGPEVIFTTDLGNVGSKNVTVPWTLGMAFAILRGDEGPGVATVTAADVETLSTTVNTLQAPVTPSDPVTPSENEVNAASNTVGMQETGIPLAGLILAILAVFGGLLVPKRK